jgi:archaemetzincin
MKGKLYLVPVGEAPGDVLTTLQPKLEGTFGVACAIAPALPQPLDAYRRSRGQYLSTKILEELGRLDLPGASRLLGVVDLDLYVPELNFVFGQATMGGRQALIALPRLRQGFYGLAEDRDLFHLRVLKEAIHELGHTLGLGHCRDRSCVMSFSNFLRDTDVKGATFCLTCRSMLAEQE